MSNSRSTSFPTSAVAAGSSTSQQRKQRQQHTYSAVSLHDPDESSDDDSSKDNDDTLGSNNTMADHQHPAMQSQEALNLAGLQPEAAASVSSSVQNGKGPESNSSRVHMGGHDDDQEGPPPTKQSHWSRRWVRYVALASILAALALLITLLVLKPWQKKQRWAPIHNEHVKALPDEQPLWPIPKSFSFGADRISVAPTFQIKVQSASKDPNQPLQTLSLATFPILEKAVSRCMDRLAVKRNATWPDFGAISAQGPILGGGVQGPDMVELIVIVQDPQAELEFGVAESYTIDIGHSGGDVGTRFHQVKAVDLEGRDLHGPMNSKIQAQKVEAAAGAGGEAARTVATLTARTQWGVIHGLETFSQLIKSRKQGATGAEPSVKGLNNLLEIPNVPWSIHDEPRFPHRGLLLDTSRHFYPVKDILRTIDAMSIVKLNVFHWHVLDQTSYPLVSKIYPLLSEKGAERPDLIYSIQDVAQIIEFGRERGIRVLPEFDAPGHTASWGRSYPNLTVCMDNQPYSNYAAQPPSGQLDPLEPFTYTLLDNLIKEWSVQFPDKQVHVGGDEVSFGCWRTSERLKDYIENPGRRTGYEATLPPTVGGGAELLTPMMRTGKGTQKGEDRLLEVYLNKVMPMYLAQNKTPIVWEEIALEHNVQLPKSTIVQVWKSAVNAKRVVQQGQAVILSSAEYWYLDCGAGQWLIGSQGQSWCGFSNWQRVYSYNLLDKMTPEEEKLVYGGEVCMWSEQTDPSNLDSNLWPRSVAAAEVLWSGSQDTAGEHRPLLQAAKRMSFVRERLVQMGVAAAPIFPSWCTKHPEACLLPDY